MTGRPDAAWGTLAAGERNQVAVLMSLLTHESALAAVQAPPVALDPEGRKAGMLELGPDYGFRFNFPDGQSLVTNKTEQGKANIPTAIGRLEALCGKTHPRQISSLLMMTCQAGLSSLRGALSPHGITSNEHSPVDFNFTKNEETGDITIRYTSPKGLPFSFEWTATVTPDGYVSSTPFRFNDEATLKKEMSATADAIKDTQGLHRLEGRGVLRRGGRRRNHRPEQLRHGSRFRAPGREDPHGDP